MDGSIGLRPKDRKVLLGLYRKSSEPEVRLRAHVVLLLAEGHAWSHGLDYRDRLEAVKSILRGEEGWREKALELGARWLFWGIQERGAYPDSTEPWKETCRLHASGSWGELYDLTLPAIPPAQ